MMNESRFSRGVITVITLMACLWVLDQICGPRRSSSMPQAVAAPVVPAAYEHPEALPTVEIQSLPLAALDNTCVASDPTDLSNCTGLVSGAPARTYAIRLGGNKALRIRAEPLDPAFDISLVVRDEQGNCLSGLDQSGPGYSEQVQLSGLPEGTFRVIVGGYGDLCGPYRLTIEESFPPLTELKSSRATRGANGTVVRWETFAETELSHFVVYRLESSSRKEVGVVRGHGSAAGFADYRVMDRQGEAGASYELLAVARDGRTQVLSLGGS